jgi:hypothetical protein
MHRFQWAGSPGKMNLATVGGVRVGLTRWNNLAGAAPRVGPITWWRRNGKGQIVLQLRPFKVGRKSLYLKVAWG